MSSTALEKMPLTKGIKDTSTKSMVKDKEEDVEKEEEEEEEDDEEAGAERTICYLHGISWVCSVIRETTEKFILKN